MSIAALKARFRRSQGFVGRKMLAALCCAPLLLLGTSSLADFDDCVEVADLQVAIDDADPNEVICVLPGTLVVPPIVSNVGGLDVRNTVGLTLLGAQAGVSAGPGGTRDANSTDGETIIVGEINFGGGTPTVQGLTIDGFRFENSGLSSNGARLNGLLRIRNSIVHHTRTYYLISVGTGSGHELELLNSNVTGQRGFSIGNARVDRALIDNNVFNTTAASLVSGSGLDGVTTVTNNVFNSPRGINILTNDGTYTGNTFNVSAGSSSRAMDIYEVTDNTITGNVYNLGDESRAFVFLAGGRAEAELNNTIVDNVIGPAGGEVDPHPVGATNLLSKMVDLRGNFWSDPAGPQVLELPTARQPRYNNVEAFGPSVSTNIQYWPWCTEAPGDVDASGPLGTRCPLEHQVPVTPFPGGGVSIDDPNTRYRTPEGQEPVQPPLFFDFDVADGAIVTDIVRVPFDFPADTAQAAVSLGTNPLVGPIMVGASERTEIRTQAVGTVFGVLSGQFASAVTLTPSSQQVEFGVDTATFTLRIRSRRQEGRLRAAVFLDGQPAEGAGVICTGIQLDGRFNSGANCTVPPVDDPATLQFVITQ